MTTAPNTSAQARTIDDRVSVIDIAGDVTGASDPMLTSAYEQACGPNTKAIVLNFQQLAYMNSSGIGLLVTLLVRLNRQQQRMLAYGLNDHYRDIFDVTRLSDVIQVCDDEPQALAASAG